MSKKENKIIYIRPNIAHLGKRQDVRKKEVKPPLNPEFSPSSIRISLMRSSRILEQMSQHASLSDFVGSDKLDLSPEEKTEQLRIEQDLEQQIQGLDLDAHKVKGDKVRLLRVPLGPHELQRLYYFLSDSSGVNLDSTVDFFPYPDRQGIARCIGLQYGTDQVIQTETFYRNMFHPKVSSGSLSDAIICQFDHRTFEFTKK